MPLERYIVLSLVTLLTCILVNEGVDHSNFKRCDQSSFCRRHRNLKDGSSQWLVLTDTVEATDTNGVKANVRNEKTGALLSMNIQSALQDGSVLRIKINELKSDRTRYENREAILDDIKYSKINLESVNANDFTITFGSGRQKHKAIFNANPFRIDIYCDDKLVVSANQRGLFKFEHFRNKDDVVEGDEPEGLWEETFKGHTDSKPHGPMSVGMDINFIGFNHVYGIPEHADAFSLKDTKEGSDPYRLYNLDVFEYELNSPMALYGSVPMMLAHSPDQTIGLLWLNPSETWIDIESKNAGVVGLLTNLVSGDQNSRSTHWISETGVIDMWFMLGPTSSDVMAQNAQISGTTQLPPYYAIGYHQCRWNYFSQNEVMDVDIGFDEHNIPLDAVWLDIEYTEGRSKKYFTWDPSTFSDPKTLTSNLTSKGRRLITIIDPHMKRDTNFPTYNEGVQNNYFIKTKDGKDYDGWCWPGSSMWPDYLNPDVTKWWQNKFNPDFFPGFEGGIVDIWNDMNEPSVFNGPEITAPKDLLHYNGFEHRDIHNAYGLLMVKSTYDGLIKHRQNLRPFILTRSFFVGSQRYCAAWTGDNMSKWTHLKAVIPMLLSMSVVGISFNGADVPGFFFNPESTELIVRWYQAGAFQPFFRGHGHIDTKRREPWLFDEQTMLHIKAAIRLRYTYLPYLYTLFHENAENGMPPLRPLWFHFPKDTNTYSIDDAHLLGDSLLVHPVTEQDVSSVSVYFPGDSNVSWLDVEENTAYLGGTKHDVPVTLSKTPYYQRSGSIIPRRYRFRRSAFLTLNDPIALDIVLDQNTNTASGQLYLDDGTTFNYKNKDYILAQITYKQKSLEMKIINGKYHSKSWLEKVTIYKYPSKPSQVEGSSDGLQYSLQFKYFADKQMLLIRKPAFILSKNWEINIM